MDDGLVIFLSILGGIIGIIIDLVIAKAFRTIAEMKGHEGKLYFWWCFLTGIAGYLMVAALPDRGKGANTAVFIG